MAVFPALLSALLIFRNGWVPPPSPSVYPRTISLPYSLRIPNLSQLKAIGNQMEASFETRRLPLGLIFAERMREYLFATHTNLRDFEWSEKEAEDLFESLYSLLDDSDDLELNTIVLLKKPVDESRNLGKLGTVYNVHDGQQRLVSLSLLLAALRDNFARWPDYDAEAQEASDMIYLNKKGLDPVTRIELREKNGKHLKSILSKTGLDGNPVDELLGSVIPRSKRKWNDYPEWDKQIFKVYSYFYDRISQLTPEITEKLFDCFKGNTYVLLLIPTDTRTARNMVMGQGKGKNVEPVDEFKGIVCFNFIAKEHEQDVTLDSWNQLCEEVGRKTVQDACILMAQAGRGTLMRKNDEVNYMENFVKEYTAAHNCDGKGFFNDVVSPASKALRELRDGHIQLAGPDQDPPSLYFLEAATGISTATDVGFVILDLLVTHKKTTHESPRLDIEKSLRKIEAIALWMMLAKPNPKERFERCRKILHFKNGSAYERDKALSLSSDEKTAVLEIIDSGDFGAGGVESKKAKAILERINEYICVTKHQQSGTKPLLKSKLQIEHILPQKNRNVPHWAGTWGHEDAEKWLHKFGNLALLNEKVNSSISNGSFEKKRESFGDSPYPLTRQISKAELWDVTEVKKHHSTIIRYAKDVWDL